MEILPMELVNALRDGQKRSARRSSRLSLHADGQIWPILRKWQGGLALDADQITHLRGAVEFYEGSRHIASGLIVASEIEAGELICTTKRETRVSDHAALDFVREEDAPIGLLPEG